MHSTTKPRVLIADDDEDTAMILRTVFEQAGAEVTVVSTGMAAVEAALSTQPAFDLITLDIRMPGMDGNEAAAKIRAGGYRGGMVAFTAAASGEGRNCSTDSGIDRYFSKTVMRKDLAVALLNEFTGKK